MMLNQQHTHKLPATLLADFTYHTQQAVFYSIKNASNSPVLVSISLEGEYHEIGNFTLNGTRIKLCETIAFNKYDNKMYSAVSLNGGSESNDFYSEYIVAVDPFTGACTLVTEIATHVANPDIDAMAFSDGTLYLFDGAPPGANFSKFFTLAFEDLHTISFPQLMYETNYLPITDLTIVSGNMYFTEERNLYKFNLSDGELMFIGQTHSSSTFNGKFIQGIAHIYSCQTAFVDLGKDTLLCSGNSLVLDATFPEANYEWQDGSTYSSFIVHQPGIYWVRITNACGSTTDSISVSFHQMPVIALGKDTVLCPGESMDLHVSHPGATILWQDGSSDAIRTVDSPGMYKVIVENACGSATDSIKIEFRNLEDLWISNVITPNGDAYNDLFTVDERLKGSSIEIFNRWGKLVYQSNTYQNDWDGSHSPAGTYFYLIKDLCAKEHIGWVQILHNTIEKK